MPSGDVTPTGDLRHRVTYQEPVETLDAYRQPVVTWQAVGTYWAEVRPLAGRELEVARQLRADVTHAVAMRRVGAIGPKGRLLFRGRTLNIVSVLDVGERRRELKLVCAEVIA